MPNTTSGNDRFTNFSLHGLFLFSGGGTVLIGQVLPILAIHFGLNDLELSFFFPAQFAGSLIGTLISSHFARERRHLTAAFAGSASMACGILMLNAGTFELLAAGFFVNGLGIGLTLPSINVAVLEASPQRGASALSILNFCWGVGAIICKPFVDLSSRGGNILITTSVFAFFLAAFGASMFVRQIPRPKAEKAGSERADEASGPPIWSRPLAWAIALFNFIHVGFESGMAGWLTTYGERLDPEHSTMLLSPTVGYFFFFIAGRAAAPAFFRYVSENKMLMLGLLTMLAGSIAAITADSIAILFAGASLSGLGTSWIFPTNVSRFSRVFGPSATRRATPLFLAGTLGAALSTWAIGAVSSLGGELRSGMYLLVAGVVILVVVQAGISILTLSNDRPTV